MRDIIYKPTKEETLKELIEKGRTFSKTDNVFIDGDTCSISIGN